MIATAKLLLPALMPSWDFFKSVDLSPRVEWCLEGASQWRGFQPRPAHVSPWTMAGRLFWNPAWNESLFMVSLAERMVSAPSRHSFDEISARVRGDIVRAGVPLAPFRFRLLLVGRDGDEIMREVVYLSPVCEPV